MTYKERRADIICREWKESWRQRRVLVILSMDPRVVIGKRTGRWDCDHEALAGASNRAWLNRGRYWTWVLWNPAECAYDLEDTNLDVVGQGLPDLLLAGVLVLPAVLVVLGNVSLCAHTNA